MKRPFCALVSLLLAGYVSAQNYPDALVVPEAPNAEGGSNNPTIYVPDPLGGTQAVPAAAPTPSVTVPGSPAGSPSTASQIPPATLYPASGVSSTPPPAYAVVTPVTVEVWSQHFHVVSEGGSYDAEILLRELELRFEVYNRLFHFNPNQLTAPLNVRAFTNEASYNTYVMSQLGAVRGGAVYLHYSQVDRRELIINRGSADEQRMLPHQAFIQFLRAFVPYPPTWMREGFAIYFGSLVFDVASDELRYEENLSWLATVKSLGNNVPSPESVMLADMKGAPEYFQPVSWALVSFFLNSTSSNGDYFRTLIESFMLLEAGKSAADNAQMVANRLFSWVDPETLKTDFLAYIQSRQTFAELVDAGQKSYSVHDFRGAEAYFLAALQQKPTHYASYYYLGLLAFENKDYAAAERYYLYALQYGADSGLVYYALGVNSATAGSDAQARDYLQRAIQASPERYRERAESIMLRLQ